MVTKNNDITLVGFIINHFFMGIMTIVIPNFNNILLRCHFEDMS